MLQNKLEKRLDLTLKSSKIFFYYIGSVFLCALISLFFYNSLSLQVQILCFLLLLLSAVIVVLNYKNKTVSHLTFTNDSHWEITINKQKYSAELSGECIVTTFLIWLNFNYIDEGGDKKQGRVMILPDSADKDLLRQLRLRLRFFKVSDEESSFTTDVSGRIIK